MSSLFFECNIIFQEAIGLSSLLPELEAHRVQLHAVVHETLGVDEFRPFFKGNIYLDLEVIRLVISHNINNCWFAIYRLTILFVGRYDIIVF